MNIKFCKYLFRCVTIFVLVIFTFMSTFFYSTKAYAYQIKKTNSWKTNINASIGTDGSITVSETKIIDITKFIEKAKKGTEESVSEKQNVVKLSPLVWNMENFPEESDLSLSDAKIAILGNNDNVIGNWQAIPTGTFLTKWNLEDSPDNNLYTYDSRDKKMCLYTNLVNEDQYTENKCSEILSNFTGTTDHNAWSSTKAIINLNYTILRAANIFKDVADFKWAYCQDTWLNDSYDVSVKVSIPIGNQSIANPLGKVTKLQQENNATTERNIYAWGHGSSNGIVDLDSNGIVSLENDIVPGGSNAEIRIVFPSAWLSNLDKQSNITQQNQTKLTTILKEESVWRDFRTDEVNKLIVPITFSSLCIIILVISLIIVLILKQKFVVKSISNKKLLDLHPCLLVRLKNWNHENAHDIVVSILRLNEKNQVDIKRLTSGDFEINLKNKNLAKNPYKSSNIDIIDKRTINLLFTTIACKNPSIKLSDIYNFANARSYMFISYYLSWHSLLTDSVNKFANFKTKYDKIRHMFFIFSIILFCLSILLGILFFEPITIAIGLFTSLIISFSGNCLRNKLYFKDENGNHINALNIDIGLGRYTDIIDKFRIIAIKKIHNSVLIAQDNVSKQNLIK